MISNTIAKALRAEFGPDRDLSEVDFYDIQHTIAMALVDAGRGGWDECWEAAEAPATRWDGKRTWPTWV